MGQRRSASKLIACLAVATVLLAACGGEDDTTTSGGGGAATESSTVKVGVLHSLSGTMGISEVAVRDASLLAIKEINAAGGVMGKQIEPVVRDGKSDWPTFAQELESLITTDKVAVTFGGWTSAS
ncbi:MAG TPA: transporter substrate-binding protein, partial [Acidimicrobiales bacterium]|nr:transporter substrate-binding protein [Acidimicrobiales bacterium]